MGVVATAFLSMAFAASASAATYTVDNTGDAEFEPCIGNAGDCSLRSAVNLANASVGVTDDIVFDATVFTGANATSTIATDTGIPNAIVIGDPVNVTGGNCGTVTAPKPCVGLSTAGGGSGLLINATGVSISGIAFTGSPVSGGIQTFQGGANITGSWFGVRLDGTTL